MAELEEQEIPEEATCPQCGGEPTDESITNHRLSNMGYLHDDVQLECEDCGTNWSLGIPIGEGPDNDTLYCDSCEDEWMLVHRVEAWTEDDDIYVQLQLKCPGCFHFDKTEPRKIDEHDLALVGYPQITGEVNEDTEEYGWELGDTPWGDDGAN